MYFGSEGFCIVKGPQEIAIVGRRPKERCNNMLPRRILERLSSALCRMGHTPSTAGDFPEEFPEKFRKDPGNALRAFPGIPFESTAGIAQTLQFKAFEAFQSISRIFSPPVRLGTPLFSEVVPERASQSRPWNSQQYWGYL